MPRFYPRQAEAMHKVHMKIQLLAQLHIKTLIAGVAPNEGGEERALETHLVPLYGLKDMGRHIFHRIAAGITSVEVIKPTHQVG